MLAARSTQHAQQHSLCISTNSVRARHNNGSRVPAQPRQADRPAARLAHAHYLSTHKHPLCCSIAIAARNYTVFGRIHCFGGTSVIRSFLYYNIGQVAFVYKQGKIHRICNVLD